MFDTVFQVHIIAVVVPRRALLMLALTKLFLPRNTRLSLVSPKLGKCNISLLLLLVCDRILTSNKRRSRSQRIVFFLLGGHGDHIAQILLYFTKTYRIVNAIVIVQIQT